MTIEVYKNLSDNNILNKNITQLGSDLTGVLKESCSIINPIVIIEDYTSFDLTKANYAYIPEFGRYYYINNIVCINNKLFELHMHVDVLMTYKSGIRSNTAVVSRQQYKNNLYLQDGVFKTYADPHIQIKQFPTGFSNYNFIFSVAG